MDFFAATSDSCVISPVAHRSWASMHLCRYGVFILIHIEATAAMNGNRQIQHEWAMGHLGRPVNDQGLLPRTIYYR